MKRLLFIAVLTALVYGACAKCFVVCMEDIDASKKNRASYHQGLGRGWAAFTGDRGADR